MPQLAVPLLFSRLSATFLGGCIEIATHPQNFPANLYVVVFKFKTLTQQLQVDVVFLWVSSMAYNLSAHNSQGNQPKIVVTTM